MVDDRFGHIIYEPDEMLFAKCLIDEKLFFEDMKKYLDSIVGDDDFVSQIISFQQFIMNSPGKESETKTFGYSFADFFNTFFGGNEDVMPEKKETAVAVKNCLETADWAEYVRVAVWYSRRMANTTVCEFRNDI